MKHTAIVSRKRRELWRLKRIHERGFIALYSQESAAYLQEFPEVTKAWIWRGMSFVPVARYDDAKRAYERALEFSSDNLRPIVWWKKGEMFQEMRDFETAINCYSLAAELDPTEGEFQALIGETLAMRGDLEQAEESLRCSLRSDCRKSEHIYTTLARVLTARKMYLAAKSCYEAALEINPEFLPAFAGRSDLKNYEWLKDHEKNSPSNVRYCEFNQDTDLTFLAHFEEKPSQDPIFWIYYGRALGSLWRYDEARAAFDKAREDETVTYHAWNYEGKVENERGDYLAAQNCFEKALALKPHLCFSSFYIGSLLFRCGELEQGEKVLRDTLKLEGDKDETLFNLGGVLLAQERYFEAIECYREAIEIDPDYEIAKIRLLDLELALRWKERHGI